MTKKQAAVAKIKFQPKPEKNVTTETQKQLSETENETDDIKVSAAFASLLTQLNTKEKNDISIANIENESDGNETNKALSSTMELSVITKRAFGSVPATEITTAVSVKKETRTTLYVISVGFLLCFSLFFSALYYRHTKAIRIKKVEENKTDAKTTENDDVFMTDRPFKPDLEINSTKYRDIGQNTD